MAFELLDATRVSLVWNSDLKLGSETRSALHATDQTFSGAKFSTCQDGAPVKSRVNFNTRVHNIVEITESC